jgi:hypothetical protein
MNIQDKVADSCEQELAWSFIQKLSFTTFPEREIKDNSIILLKKYFAHAEDVFEYYGHKEPQFRLKRAMCPF